MDSVFMVYYLLAADSVKALPCSWQVYLSIYLFLIKNCPRDRLLKRETHFILNVSPQDKNTALGFH